MLVVVSGDHFNQWFYDNMPTFVIGKAARARGPFPHEEELFGVSPYDTALERDVARHLLRTGPSGGSTSPTATTLSSTTGSPFR